MVETKRVNIHPVISLLLGLGGAVAGGVLGHFAFLWIAQQGFYALALPGALLGVGCGMLAPTRSVPLAAVCGGLALVLGIFSEWRCAPFIKSSGLGYFLSHLSDLRPLTLFMIVLGGVLGFYFALGSKGKAGAS